jgi:hypothetical protein
LFDRSCTTQLEPFQEALIGPSAQRHAQRLARACSHRTSQIFGRRERAENEREDSARSQRHLWHCVEIAHRVRPQQCQTGAPSTLSWQRSLGRDPARTRSSSSL